MGHLKTVLVIVLLAQVCHALQQSFGAKEIKTELLRRLAVKEAESADEEVESRNETEAGNKRSSSSTCKLYTVPVDVKDDLGWDSWVVVPTSFNATYCKGECPFPIPNHLEPTSHAVFQRLIHSVDSNKVPGPCCVPIKFRPMDMLIKDNGNTVRQTYNKMIATKCGCM